MDIYFCLLFWTLTKKHWPLLFVLFNQNWIWFWFWNANFWKNREKLFVFNFQFYDILFIFEDIQLIEMFSKLWKFFSKTNRNKERKRENMLPKQTANQTGHHHYHHFWKFVKNEKKKLSGNWKIICQMWHRFVKLSNWIGSLFFSLSKTPIQGIQANWKSTTTTLTTTETETVNLSKYFFLINKVDRNCRWLSNRNFHSFFCFVHYFHGRREWGGKRNGKFSRKKKWNFHRKLATF